MSARSFPLLPLLPVLAASLAFTGRSRADDPLPQAKPLPPWHIEPAPRQEFSLQWRDYELTRYLAGTDLLRPAWFPVRLAGQPSVTRWGHPRDPQSHSHHNSVWISYQNVDGINFWEDTASPKHGRIVQEKVQTLTDGADACGVEALNKWMANADPTASGSQPRLIVRERRRFFARPAAGVTPDKAWWLVIDLSFTAPTAEKPVTFGETAFGPIGIRMAKSVGVNDGGGRILNSNGQVNEPAAFRQPAKWCDYSGRLTETTDAGVTLMDHPDNPGHPAPIHIRNDGWMGASPMFTGPQVATADKPLTFRYALFVHEGTSDRAALDARWEEFRAMPR